MRVTGYFSFIEQALSFWFDDGLIYAPPPGIMMGSLHYHIQENVRPVRVYRHHFRFRHTEESRQLIQLVFCNGAVHEKSCVVLPLLEKPCKILLLAFILMLFESKLATLPSYQTLVLHWITWFIPRLLCFKLLTRWPLRDVSNIYAMIHGLYGLHGPYCPLSKKD